MRESSEHLSDPHAEALDRLVSRILSEIAGAGVVPSGMAERVGRAQDRIAQGKLPRGNEARSALSAELARIVVSLAEVPPVKPTYLKLVHDAHLGRSGG
jgi:hypothetical protein